MKLWGPGMALIIAGVVAVGCGDTTGPDEDTEAGTPVGPEGGIVTFDGLTLEIPAGALSEEVRITVEPASAAAGFPQDVLALEGAVYDLGPDGLTFAEPVAIAIGYGRAGLPDGVGEPELQMLRLSGGVEVLPSTLDRTARTVHATTDRFSSFAVGLETGSLDRVACPDLSPVASEGVPLDMISLGSLPDDFDPPWLVEVAAVETDLSSHGVVREDPDGGAELVVPLHPSASPEGGPAVLNVTDGTRACAGFDFEIQPLPPAPGELGRVADVFQEILVEQAAVLESTPDEILATPVEDLAPAYYPVALAQSTLDDRNNERSLRAIAAGTTPDADQVRLDLVEPLLAQTSFRSELEAVLARVRRRRTPSTSEGPSAPIVLGLCTPEQIGQDAGLLDHCMEKAQNAAFHSEGATGEVLSDLSAALGALGLVPGIGTAADVLGFATWLFLNSQEKNAALLPSFLTDFELSLTREEFLEDVDATGRWSGNLTASNSGWDMGKELLGGLLQAGQIAGTFDKAQVAGPEVDDLLAYIITGPVADQLLDGGTLESFQIDPVTFGPVMVNTEGLSEARIAGGDAVELTSHTGYEPRAAGTATLAVRTAEGRFGGQQLTDDAEILVRQIQLKISPEEVFLDAGEVQEFTVTVQNSSKPHMVEHDPRGELQGTVESMEIGSDNVHTLRYRAPQDPDPDRSDLVTVRHTAESGARGHTDEERNATATIRFATLVISPRSGCIEPGASEQFTAELRGVSDPDVEWEASVGQIDGDGLFTAPSSVPDDGEVIVTASLVDEPDVRDSVRITIGGCSCRINVEVDGVGVHGDEGLPHFLLTTDGTGVHGVNWVASGVAVSFGFTEDPSVPGSIAIGATGGPFPVSVSGTLDGLGTYDSFYKSNADPTDLAPPQAFIDENDHDVLAGTVGGSVWLWSADRAATFNLSFRIEVDASVSDDQRRRCILE